MIRERVLTLKKSSDLPKHIEAAITVFESQLTEEQMKDPAYRISYAFVPVVAKKLGAADAVVQVVSPGSEEAGEIEKIIFKEVNKNRYTPTRVVELVQARGFPKFRRHDHTLLWRSLNAKREGNGFGCVGDYHNWVWFDRWIDEVIKHCENKGNEYR